MTRLAEIYAAAAAILEPEGAWTQDATARDRDGLRVERPDDPAAVAWDVLAAIELAIASSGVEGEAALLLFWEALEDLFDTDMAALAWNDAPGRTQAEVLAFLRAAAGIRGPGVNVRSPAGFVLIAALAVALAVIVAVATVASGAGALFQHGLPIPADEARAAP